ncbi:uncharacterized protein YukE [Actinoalloteichus hoggarensis]|uniref:Putative T7SS secretion signal domain-containing protein n=1 Tax=Actinoalloteichus hoggarensis TaxID=1470176 RepID=A0A221VYR1_9PSEU|nr:hypothetical protein [Actinoalloteichus hoggarensis]ASO18682.1 hypothetical protein AHOG_05145 [Actinoalloteichus hoggarensis]MBB5919913.1 uncharacterized protein YukE [Actinoalloteichus hoggarensis]
MSNPLVADVVDSTTSTSGLSLVESVNSTNEAIASGDWLEAGLGTADLVMTALDPFAAIFANGVGWLIEHVGPLSDALDSLAGSPDEIRSHAETWTNVATEVSEVSTELSSLVGADISSWTGAASDAYRDRATDTANLILAAGNAAHGAAEGIQLAGEVVSAVRDAVRDIIADVVGSIISWALQVVFTLGIGLIWVVPKVVAKIAQTAAKIAQLIQKLVSSMSRLSPLLKKLGDDFGAATQGLKAIKPGDSHTSRALDAPPAVAPSGARGGGDLPPPVRADVDSPGSSGGSSGTRGLPDGGASRSPGDSGPAVGPSGSRGLPDGGASRSPGNAGPALNPSHFQGAPLSGTGGNMPGVGGPPSAPTPPNPPAVPNVPGVHVGPNGPQKRVFPANSVASVPLTDSQGNTVGVGFPSKPQDQGVWQPWAQGQPHWNQAYFQRDPSTGALQAAPAPWGGGVHSTSPFAAMAHSNGNQFTVTAPTGPSGQMETVFLSPEGYRQVMASNQTYQAAMSGNDRPLLLASCDAASGSGAQRFANDLRQSGDQRPVYAPTGEARPGRGANNNVSGLSVDNHGTTPGTFTRY